MKMHSLLALIAVGVLAPSLFAKGTEPKPKFNSSSATITNKYWPLSELKMDVLEGTEEGKSLRVQRSVKPGTKEFNIDGQKVQALIMEDREFMNGELEEVTLDYFAQDEDGNVYYLGEDVDNYKDGKIVKHEGQWLYGKETKHLGLIMTAKPAVGQKFSPENVPHVTREDDMIESVDYTSTVPAGTYTGCVKVKERLDDGSTEYKDYAPGVGVVREYGANKEGVPMELKLITHNQ